MEDLARGLRNLRVGFTLSLAALLLGVGLGVGYLAHEKQFKDHLKKRSTTAPAGTYADEAARKKTTDKAWVYLKRAHTHSAAAGSLSALVILAMALLPGSCLCRRLSATALGIGSLSIGLFWLLAGLRAPGLGGTGAAKKGLLWLAVPAGAGSLLGLLAAATLILLVIWRKPAASEAVPCCQKPN